MRAAGLSARLSVPHSASHRPPRPTLTGLPELASRTSLNWQQRLGRVGIEQEWRVGWVSVDGECDCMWQEGGVVKCGL